MPQVDQNVNSLKNQLLFKKCQIMPFFSGHLSFCKIWLYTFSKIFLVLCTKLIFRCQKFVDELLISKGITLFYTKARTMDLWIL